MLENLLSTAVGEQPKLGKPFYEDALIEEAKKKKKEDDLNKVKGQYAAARGFMPKHNVQAAEAMLKGMEDAYVSGDMAVYNTYKEKLATTLAVGKARYDAGRLKYEQGLADNEFANTQGGREAAQMQWDVVFNKGFDSIPVPDGKGNVMVSDDGDESTFDQTVYYDIKEINAGRSDYILNKKSTVPEMAIPMLGAKEFVPFVNMDADEDLETAIARAMRHYDDIAMTEDMRKAAALYFAREVEGVGEQGLLTTADKERAYAKYAVLNADGSVPTATASAMEAHRNAIRSQLEPYYYRNREEQDPRSGLGADQKRILDQPLLYRGRENYVRPDGRANRTPVYKMDFKRLAPDFDKIEGQKVREVYFDVNGELDHMTIDVPAKKLQSSITSLEELMSGGQVTIDGLPVDPQSYQERVLKMSKRAPNKMVTIRIFDPRELDNTFGTTVGSLLSQKIQMQTASDMEQKNSEQAPFDAMADAMSD